MVMTYPSPFVPPRPGRAATGEHVTEKLGAAMRAANSTRTNQVCHMNAIVRRTIASIATAILSMGLISACAGREEGEKMEPCTGTIYTLRTAILYPLIDSFPYLTVYSTDAQVVDGTPEAEVRVEWDEGVNRPANLNETLKLGESATLEKVGTFTLIGMEPPAHGKRWPDPVVCFEQDPQLMDTARQYAADNDLYFRPDDEEARQS